MTEENSQPQTETENVSNEVNEVRDTQNNQPNESVENEANNDGSEKSVPLSVVQKERKKRQQLQKEIEELRQSNQQKPNESEDDYSKYETVTREELGQDRFLTKREIREEDYANQWPERVAIVDAELEDFLKQRPNLAPAISSSENRYKEAWDLMQAFKPQSSAHKKVQKNDAPRSPGTVPKSAATNETIDVMNMSDNEFREWAKSKRRRR